MAQCFSSRSFTTMQSRAIICVLVLSVEFDCVSVVVGITSQIAMLNKCTYTHSQAFAHSGGRYPPPTQEACCHGCRWWQIYCCIGKNIILLHSGFSLEAAWFVKKKKKRLSGRNHGWWNELNFLWIKICKCAFSFSKESLWRPYKAMIIRNIKTKSQLIYSHRILYILYIHSTTHYTYFYTYILYTIHSSVHSSVLFKQRHPLETRCIPGLHYDPVSLCFSALKLTGNIYKVVISCNQGNQTESIQPTGLVSESFERRRKNDKDRSHLALTREACLIGFACYDFINPLWGTLACIRHRQYKIRWWISALGGVVSVKVALRRTDYENAFNSRRIDHARVATLCEGSRTLAWPLLLEERLLKVVELKAE